jgi:6-phosphogluconolactonase
MDVLVLDDPAAEAARRLAAAAGAGGHVALAGGSTPRAAYAQAAELLHDWGPATLWFGDERAVGPGDERSNFGMARAALLDHITGTAPAVQRIEGERGHEAAAVEYAQRLRRTFGDGMPTLDLVLLGIGPDGHTASLFPGKPAVTVRDRVVVGVPEPGLDPRVPRITLTVPALCAARAVLFLIRGADKAPAVVRAFGGGPPEEATPSSLIRPDAGTLTVLLDAAAAADLELPA